MSTANTLPRVSNGRPINEAINGRSKVEHYGWTVVDEPGKIMYLPKETLKVDPSYQREETERKVLRIASEWSWMACGTILVADRSGEYFVFDGWHRVNAAMRRSDIANLPCLVFMVSEVSQEAKGFLRANTDRQAMTAVEKFNAKIMTGDMASIKVQEMVAKAGYKITKAGSAPRTLACVSALQREVIQHPEAFDRVWPLIVEACGGDIITEHVVQSIGFIEHALEKKGAGESLTRNPWRARVLALGGDGIANAAKKAAAYYAKGGSRVWASGVVDALNKGVQKRLSLSKADAEVAD